MEANDKARLLREIQLCTFLLTEANLYLDTHPDDQDALKFYEKHAARLRELARPGDLILTVGAGDIYTAGEALVRGE